jgi:hypothetical protein
MRAASAGMTEKLSLLELAKSALSANLATSAGPERRPR